MNQPNLTAAAQDCAATSEGMAASNLRDAAETRARMADAQAHGWDRPTDGGGVYLSTRIEDAQEKAARYKRNAEAFRRGYMITGRANGNDDAWCAQFRDLMPRFMREERCVNPDLPHVDLNFYIRGPVT
jgi:hypothetical protein